MQVAMEWFAESIGPVVGAYFGPGSRVAPLYVGATILLAILIWRLRGAPGSFLRWAAPKEIYLHQSHMTDIKLFALGRLFIAFGLVSRLGLATTTALMMQDFLSADDATDSNWPPLLITLVLVLVGDFKVYWVHRLHHQISALWPFHEVHHSAEVMTPITVYRKHPVYDLFSQLAAAVLVGGAQGVLLALFVGKVTVVQVVGANAFYFLFNVLGANFRHSHIWVSYGRWVEHVLISPAQHQVHHSIELRHRNKNFGEIFAIWDWMFGTLYTPQSREDLAFGLSDDKGVPIPQPHGSLRQALVRPVVDSWRAIVGRGR